MCEIVQFFFGWYYKLRRNGRTKYYYNGAQCFWSCYNTVCSEANCEFGSRKNYRAREYTSEVWKEGFANNRLFGKKKVIVL